MNLKKKILLALIILLSLFVFAPGLSSYFSIDSYFSFGINANRTISEVVKSFIPVTYDWYRPITELVMYLEYKYFNLNPLPYHVISYVLHMVTAYVIYLFSRKYVSNKAALFGSLVFMFSIYGHEPLFDTANIHNVLSALVIMLSIYSFEKEDYRKYYVLLIIALLIDEAGVLIPLITLGLSLIKRNNLFKKHNVLSLMVILIYVIFRFTLSSGVMFNEVEGKRYIIDGDFWLGMVQYINRLFLRPESLINYRTIDSFYVFISIIISLGLLNISIEDKKIGGQHFLFGIFWIIATCSFYVLLLWPYNPDRFLYIPGIGLSFITASLIDNYLKSKEKLKKLTNMGATVFLIIWFLLGIFEIYKRGVIWKEATYNSKYLVEKAEIIEFDENNKIIKIQSDYENHPYKTIYPGNDTYNFRDVNHPGFPLAFKVLNNYIEYEIELIQ